MCWVQADSSIARFGRDGMLTNVDQQYFATIGVADDEMQMDKQQYYAESDPAKK